MRPVKQTPAHHTDKFAELVCSNSLRGNALTNGVGVLKFNLLISSFKTPTPLVKAFPRNELEHTSSANLSVWCAGVCSNSLRGNALTNGVGVLKEEMRRLNSIIIEAADKARVPAGGALAVDRHDFSGYDNCVSIWNGINFFINNCDIFMIFECFSNIT
jgi:folate-dependent tRNA-U54 methylase TrmFO/GidA